MANNSSHFEKEVKQLKEEGKTIREIAKSINMSKSFVHKILNAVDKVVDKPNNSVDKPVVDKIIVDKIGQDEVKGSFNGGTKPNNSGTSGTDSDTLGQDNPVNTPIPDLITADLIEEINESNNSPIESPSETLIKSLIPLTKHFKRRTKEGDLKEGVNLPNDRYNDLGVLKLLKSDYTKKELKVFPDAPYEVSDE